LKNSFCRVLDASLVDKPISLIIGDSLGKGLIILGMFVASYYLPFDEFAMVTLGYSLVSTIWFFLDLGVNIKGIRWLSNNKYRQYKSLASLRTIGGVFTFLLLVVLLFLDQTIMSLFLVGSIFRVMSFDWLMRANMKYIYLGLITFLSGLIFFVFILLSSVMNVIDAKTVAISYSASFGFFFIGTRFLQKDFTIYVPKKKVIKVHILSSSFFSLSGIVVASLIHAPVFILGFTGAEEYEIARLGVIILFINSAAFLISIYVLALMPIMAKNANRMKNSTPLLVSGLLAAICIFFGLFGYNYIKDFDFTFLEMLLPSIFVALYSLRRLFDSRLLLSKGELMYLLISMVVLFFLICVFFFGMVSDVSTIATVYGFSLLMAEVLFLILLRNAIKGR
jgi:O-antigen/teichoic acid export membrane protein